MKFMLSAVCIAVVVMHVSALSLRPPPPSKDCTYYCQKGSSFTYVCCDAGPIKQCPPVRDTCPPSIASVRPPNICRSDSSCRGSEKCCHDTCLGHRTCKPAITG
ncbi:WAP-type 'four-disulfide core' domain [Trinorchestia longiramus]|nr:WAP-type 'four-disulfide core' domain [Trinorchestia longiramus]